MTPSGDNDFYLLHCSKSQDCNIPSVMLVMGDGEPWDPGDDMVMDRQDHLPINVDESNLEE